MTEHKQTILLETKLSDNVLGKFLWKQNFLATFPGRDQRNPTSPERPVKVPAQRFFETFWGRRENSTHCRPQDVFTQRLQNDNKTFQGRCRDVILLAGQSLCSLCGLICVAGSAYLQTNHWVYWRGTWYIYGTRQAWTLVNLCLIYVISGLLIGPADPVHLLTNRYWIGLTWNLADVFIWGLPRADYHIILVMLFWSLAFSWPLIGQSLSILLQTNHWLHIFLRNLEGELIIWIWRVINWWSFSAE